MADCYREDGPSFLIKINAPVAASFNFSFQTPKKRALSGASGGSHGAEGWRARATGRDAGRQDPDPTEGPHGLSPRKDPNEKPHLTLE